MSGTLQALEAFKTLSEQIYELEVRAEERLKAQHGRFNIFTTLLSAHDEVRLHTRFLHELLNPEGTHDCGDLFLRLFLETLSARQPLDHNDSPSEESWKSYLETTYWVGKEVRKDQGQLDLLLESNTHLLVIENKIWAHEQEKQVARYIEYTESQKKIQSQVLYLTLEGKPATTNNGKSYLRISYQEHIMAWLERCLQATYNIVPINQVLIQYRGVVKQLIGQTLEANTMETIINFIRNNPKIIIQRQGIDQGISALRIEVRNHFKDALILALSSDYYVEPRPDMRNNNFGEDPYADLIIRPIENDFTAPHHDAFEIWIEQVDANWKGLIIGIESGWNKKRPLNLEEETLLRYVCEAFQKFYSSLGNGYATDQVTFGGTHWPCSWHSLIFPFMESDKSFAKMLEPDYFNSQVQKAAEEVRDYMGLLRKFFKEAIESISQNHNSNP